MHSVYHITPTLEHHVCMVDLFSRTGNFDIAICIIEQAPDTDSPLLWSALLGACQTWMNAELGKWVFECALQLDDNFGAAYNSMSNIYAALGMYNAG
ncbi:hypothetical protein KP509_16G072200 [Ceratopteris richardii]|uniref:Pentatricopeptide repeat-containing protein n=1 Tax=Ceratopteris richardii TaxID=49495 RepID=A0A8T2T417_CERRI|nr:hypothetical protein KP509_16G072200 [Ceratopteris richardii]